MIGVKLVGTLTLLAVGGAFATSSVQAERRRLSMLDAWIELLLTVRREIDCYLRPIDEILKGCPPSLRHACAAGGNGDTPEELLRDAAPHLDRDAYRLLERFSGEIGSTYREEELRCCDFYIQALRSHRDAVAAEHPARVKLGVTLSLSAALGTIILLW